MKNPLQLLRPAAVGLAILFGATNLASAQVSVGIGISVPGLSIGINMPSYPQFVRVPNYPVYYAPGQQTNFFFYDGLYWVYQQDNWYSSSWYDGPWYGVAPQAVPLFVLRIPVRYYRNPPSYFSGWRADAPPRWGDHWGNDWSRQRPGWDRWNPRAAPAPAPLPSYQRQYSGDRYPRVAQQQQALQTSNYRYQQRDSMVRQQVQRQAVPAAPPERVPQAAAPRSPERQARPAEPQRQQAQQQGGDRRESQAPTPPQRQVAPERQPAAPQGNNRREPQAPAPQGRDTAPARANPPSPPQPAQGQGRGAEQERGNSKAQDNNRGQGRGQDKDKESGDEPGQQRKR